jgi:FkbM family methyltransferase
MTSKTQFMMHLKGVIPDRLREWYRRMWLNLETVQRRRRHLHFLKEQYFPFHLPMIQRVCSREMRNDLEPLLNEFDPSSKCRDSVLISCDGMQHPIYVRRNTSDLAVLVQVFLERQYDIALDRLRSLPGAGFIDCGANIGLTSRFFLDALPDRRAVLIEPCPDNLRICRQNLAPYGSSVKVIPGAVWQQDGLSFGLTDTGLLEWGVQCRVNESLLAKEGAARTYTMETLARMLGDDPVGLVKIDIEGGERDLFANGDVSWVRHVKNIAIEIHGDSCAAAVESGLSNFRFDVENCGEITMYSGIHSIDSQ